MKHQHFVIVGAQRSGSSYLAQVLGEHPQIEMAQPMKPEPKYFLGEPDKLAYHDYLSKHFTGNGRVLGEKSTSYIDNEIALGSIKKTFPDVRIILILRNPVFRAISNYFFSVNNGLESRSLEEVFIENKPEPVLKRSISVSPFDYLGRSNYELYLDRLERSFDRNQRRVVIFEHLVNRLEPIQELFEFVGASRTFEPGNLQDRINSSHRVHGVSSEIVKHLHNYFEPMTDRLERILETDLSDWR